MTEIISQADFAHIKSIAADAFESRLLSPEIRNAQAAFFVAAVGAELGLSPIQSLQNIYVIKGKAILSSHAILAIVMRRRDVCKYFRLVESTAERATYQTLRDGYPEPSSFTYTLDDARRANLLSNPTWKNHPAAMLRARCGTSLARAVYPDLILGLYDEEEAVEIRGDVAVSRVEPVASVPVAIDASRVPPALPAAEPTTEPAGAFAPTDAERIEKYRAEIEACDATADLYEIAKSLQGYPVVRDALRALYTEKRKSLEQAQIQAIAAAHGQPA